ncbi:MAG: ligand-binding sensor domain-containing protein [Flavobacteriales bacterium]|jgi:ligand-binding sensor domain-containing protein
MTLLQNYSLLILLALFASCRIGQSQSTSASENESELDDKELFIDHRIDPSDHYAGDVVTSGFLDKDGNMWFTTLTEGVYKYDGSTFLNITTKEGLCSNKVNAVIEDFSGLLWFATSKGLCSYDGEVFAHFPLPQEHIPSASPETGYPSRKTEEVLSLIQDINGHFWLGTISGGAYGFDGKTFTSFLKFKGRIQPRDSVYNNCIQSVVEDNSGNIWFTSQTHGGISRYDGNEFIHFTKEDGLPDDMIFSSFKDVDGQLWFGTLDGGLISYSEGLFSYFNENDGLNNNMVSCFYQDKSGKLWIGSFRGSTVSWFDQGDFMSVPFDEDQKLVELRFISEDKDGNVWFGGRYGLLYRYDGEKLKDFTSIKRTQ